MINIRAKEKGRNDRKKKRSEGKIVNQQPSATKREMEEKKREKENMLTKFLGRKLYILYILYMIYI